MPRGAEYDDKTPHSDNAVEAGEDLAHGTDTNPESIYRSHKVASLPDGISETKDGQFFSGGGSRGIPEGGSGKGRHDPKTMGEQKGLGAHKEG